MVRFSFVTLYCVKRLNVPPMELTLLESINVGGFFLQDWLNAWLWKLRTAVFMSVEVFLCG